MFFGEVLRDIREKRGISKTDLSRELKVTIGYIVNLESSRRKPPTLDNCQKIIRYLKLPPVQATQLLLLAVRERAPKEFEDFFKNISDLMSQHLKDTEVAPNLKGGPSKMDPELNKALQDPLARRALIATFKDAEFRKAMEYMFALPENRPSNFLGIFEWLYAFSSHAKATPSNPKSAK